MPSQPTPIAPKYRYFTVDLLTNEMLAEIPLRGVSYECAIKGAGKFQGKIPITAETNSMDLYNSTMPGNTAIFVLRNGVCVWGGIIWSREYQFSTRDLSISASEFTSYFYHRKIWKTWSHQYGGTLSNTGSGWQFVYDTGSDVLVQPGSTVNFEFYEPENFKYNGMYRVSTTPSPSTLGFSLDGGADVSDLTSFVADGSGWITFYTKENHGYSTGDALTLNMTMQAFGGVPSIFPGGVNVPMVVDVPQGPNSNWFRWNNGSGAQEMTLATGTFSRNLPQGIYQSVTVTVRMDTYDYIRSLIDSVFNDFVGTDFPNVYIEPGISYSYNVTSRRAINGFSILETEKPHNVAPGQAVQIKDVGPAFDGEFEVSDTPSPTTLVYKKGGNLPTEAVAPKSTVITQIQMVSGLATITTSVAHGYVPGNSVTISLGDAYPDFNGTWEVKDIPTATTFRFSTFGTSNYDTITLTDAITSVPGKGTNKVTRVSVSGNAVTLALATSPITYVAGDSATVTGVDRVLQIKEKALDAQNSRATILTVDNHGLQTGDTVVISGLSDSASLISKTTTGSAVTMTTDKPHNFRVNSSVTIAGLDLHKIVNKSLTSNVATLTTEVNNNTPVGASITVSDLRDSVAVSARQLTGGTARVTTGTTHNFKINDQITVDGLSDQYAVVSKEASNGYVTLTIDRPHNILVGQKILVQSVGMPFDGTDIEVVDITATRVMYNIDSKYWDTEKAKAAASGQTLSIPATVPPSKAAGTLTAVDSYYNGTFVLTGVGSNWVEYFRGGEDQTSAAATGTNYMVSGLSVMNGTYVVSARTANTLSFAVTANNIPSTVVPISSGDDAPAQPLISLPTIHAGTQVITATTSNTFTFSQTTPSAATQTTVLTAAQQSVFNGTRTVTGTPTPKRFTFSMPGFMSSVLEQITDNVAHARVTSLYNGTYTIILVDSVNNTITFSKTLLDYGSKSVPSRGAAIVSPIAVVSSFGPYPGNADIGLQYSSRGYAGINVEPIAYRGFELKSVGEALDSYSDNIDGFEYRIDCSYDPELNRFIKTFVLIAINFPDPPAPGEVAPLSRYGADKLVFEYPGGNITEVSINESAEESATRFFAVGTSDLGPDAGPNIGVASSEELLRGKDGRMWPLLDASEQIDGVEDKNVLYSHAQRYLSEAAPPFTNLSVSLNGSIAPFVGSYRPGDWCSLILNDPFARMRLQSDLEPRNDVVVRKIDSFQVNVPDGVTFPETVSLHLVAEWEIDKRGK